MAAWLAGNPDICASPPLLRWVIAAFDFEDDIADTGCYREYQPRNTCSGQNMPHCTLVSADTQLCD
jgi:hypothetical protein